MNAFLASGNVLKWSRNGQYEQFDYLNENNAEELIRNGTRLTLMMK